MSDQKWDDCAPPYPPLTCQPQFIMGSHNYTQGPLGAINAALAAGVDANCGPLYKMWLPAFAANGSVSSAALDTACARVYTTLFKLGLFDQNVVPGQVYPMYSAERVDSQEHRDLARVAAQESIVLLKNDGDLLPLKIGLKVAFLGPHANCTQNFLSNYHGDNTLVNAYSPLAAALARGIDVTYTPGCNICDMDGTLLNSRHEISDYSTNVLRLLCAKGISVAIVTGRSAVNTYKYVNTMGLEQAELFLITYNGTFCTRINATLTQPQPTVDVVFSYPLETQHARMLIDLASDLGLVLQYYNAENGEIYACPRTDEHRELIGRYASLVGQQQVLLSSYEEAICRCNTQKVLIFTKDTDQLIFYCKEKLPAGLFHMIRGSPDPYFVEFLPVGVTKGFAVEKLCREVLKIDVANVVAMGDGDNDLEMIQAVGMGIAMVNGRSVLKASAKRTSAFTNDEDGAARELEEIFCLGY